VDHGLDVYVHIEPLIDLAFAAESPAAEGAPVIQTLWDIYNYVSGTVVPLLVPYL
jgi:hypothetical protein